MVRTVPGLLLRFANTCQKSAAFLVKEGGRWTNVSTADFMARVEALFFGLRALSVKTGDRVCILSENRLEWAIADYAITALGAITVPIYPTLPAAQVEYLLRNSDASVAFVSTSSQLDKIASARGALPSLRFVIVFDRDVYQPGALQLEMVLDIGRQASYEQPGEFVRSAERVQSEDVATVIYTSGTTGIPKGVMLTHGNLVSNVLATIERLPIGPDDIELSFLPLSHIFQRHVDYAAVCAGSTIAYCENPTAAIEDMVQVRPTFAAGVPRLFEKIYARVHAEVARSSGLRRRVFETGLNLSPGSLFLPLADRLIFRKVRARLGGRIRWFVSAGAALDPSIAEFFSKVGIPILEGYGLTETSPVITFTAPGAARFGKVGQTVGDVQVRIASDGEILVRGSNVMRGYYKMQSETEQALRDGWFHTGDIGRVDDEGYLEITDRKKDLIVTSTGKKVAPQPLEMRLRRIRYFENVMVVGEGRNFISALIVPNYDTLAAYARTHEISFDRPQELIQRQEIYEMAMREIESQTGDLAEFEKVRKIAFVDREFSIASGDLTPTLKIRRREIEKKYQREIERLYAA